MTDDQIMVAARKWRLRLDTQTIAKQMNLPEYEIYNNLWRIRARASAGKVA